jgi:Uncharacterized protein conserved in bacteria (DUF2184)
MKILNSRGEEIKLTPREQRVCDINQRMVNALGYEINITTLTTIMKKITEQKFFEIPPADYIPIRVGEGAWSTNLVTYRSFAIADDFATGILNTGGNNARLANADAAVDSVPVKVQNWAKGIGWSLFDLEFAAKSGNWDLVTAKEHARKKNWDLGVQKIAFLGLLNNVETQGLFQLGASQGVTVDTTTITAPINNLSVSALKTFCTQVLNVYRFNNQRTAWPTHFIMPESDFLGLAAPASSDFPIRSTLSLLEETFQVMTKNPKFKILSNAYGDGPYNNAVLTGNGSLGYQMYALLNYDEESIRMDIPVDYTSTLANSLDNFSFQNAAYGQLTGVVPYRPLETYLFQFPTVVGEL